VGPREVQTWVGEPRSHRVSLVTAENTSVVVILNGLIVRYNEEVIDCLRKN